MDELISRQAAIDAIDSVLVEDESCKVWFKLAVKNLPSAQPERKRGKWIDGYKRQTCSLCKGKGVRSWNYCPYCGADMREVDDE